VAILSIDLAHRRWSDLGIVILDRPLPAQPAPNAALKSGLPLRQFMGQSGVSVPAELSEPPIQCQVIQWAGPGLDPGDEIDPETGLQPAHVDPEILAGRINHFANLRGIRIVMLDGPQAWKSRSNGLEHARVSERQLNTPAKTGLPGLVKPLSMRPYAEFCLDLYDSLCRRGWRRLDTREQPSGPLDRVLIESNPLAAWKSLGLKPLVSKRRAHIIDLAEAYSALHALIPFTTDHPPNHDQLQAIVAGLAGLALDERNTSGARIVGNPPRREDGHWREGYIVLPVPPLKAAGIRWLH
jgi:hypothetical protein